jgi:hypothetical protein
VLEALAQTVPYYFKKYVKENRPRTLRSIASMAQRWSAEDSLKNIISWWQPHAAVDWEVIDRRIGRLNKQVVHDVPKLLRPLVAMQDENNPILGFMELGAYRTEVRRLIELGVPRETAIRVRAKIKRSDIASLTDRGLLGATKEAAAKLNLWERLQIDSLSWDQR